jgi:3-oxoadipate enol-lactonase
MHCASLDGMQIDYQVRGAGEPVLFIHGGLCAAWFDDLLDRPELNAAHRLIGYHRVGYAGSSRIPGTVSIDTQAAHGWMLMRHLNLAPAHVVGHSSGASIALQLALDHPESVRSLALLETALLAVPTGPFAAAAMRHYRGGDKTTAVHVWMRGVAGPDYRATLSRILPGAFDQAVRDADTFFGQELPAVRGWSFGPADAQRITQPVLAVLGGNSWEVTAAFGQRHDLLLAWLPVVTSFVLPAATHLLHVQNPGGMAARLARFFTDVEQAPPSGGPCHQPPPRTAMRNL